MAKLRTRISLVMGIVLFIATFLPILIFYLLGVSGLVELTYVTESQATTRQDRISERPLPTPPLIPELTPFPGNIDSQNEEGLFPVPKIDPVTGERIPDLTYDPTLGRWIVEIPSDLQRVVFTSPVFKFRIDVPAWFVLGSLPVISLLLAIFLSLLMSRSVTQPISQLVEATRAIGRRELGYRVQAKGSQELQDLGQSFNRMAEELEHAEITRRNLMADVAHELRTPLAVLDGNLRAMLDGVHELNEDEIALLYEQTHHLNRLVDDLREISLAEADKLPLDRREVDLAWLIKETVAHFHLLAKERGIQLTIDVTEPLVHPRMDENRIRQVLHNLLSNAFRYTPAGGKVMVSARRSLGNNTIEIIVTDTGSGILPEELPYIFDRFYRTETTAINHGGTGLGLAIVKAIVELHGGTIDANSGGRNQGSAFLIKFPV